MAPDVGVASKGSNGKNGGTSSRHTLKKGPWTAAEDAILMEYVKKHGEGNWNAVQRNSGLMRCGKSCRLRWANHLRPNLKKGAFSSEEEALIVELHAKLGNKWARMASQLPGRTDNEIKNYWNTRLKRRQRAGLPIYPHDVNVKAHSHPQESSQTNPSSSSLAGLLSPPPPALNPGYDTPLSLFDIFNPSAPTMKPRMQQPNASYLPNPNPHFKFFQENNSGLALSLSSSCSPFSSSSGYLPFNNRGFSNSVPIPPIQYNCLNFGSDSTPVSGVSFEQNGVVPGRGVELPSIQSLVPRTTPTSSTNNASDDYMIATSSDADEHETNQGFSSGNSGLLEDLIDESQALTRSEKSKEILPAEVKSQENYLWDYKVMEGLNFSQDNVIQDQEKHIQESSPAHSSIRAKTGNASSEQESHPVDDDFLSLLDNFPMSVPVPDWCDGKENIIQNGHNSSSSAGGESRKENYQESSNSIVETTSEKTNNNFDIGSCCWKNMPGIYQM